MRKEKQVGTFSCFDLLLLLFVLVTPILPMENVKVGTLNVYRARDVRKLAMLYELVKLKYIDVLFLQETHSDNENVLFLLLILYNML